MEHQNQSAVEITENLTPVIIDLGSVLQVNKFKLAKLTFEQKRKFWIDQVKELSRDIKAVEQSHQVYLQEVLTAIVLNVQANDVVNQHLSEVKKFYEIVKVILN